MLLARALMGSGGVLLVLGALCVACGCLGQDWLDRCLIRRLHRIRRGYARGPECKELASPTGESDYEASSAELTNEDDDITDAPGPSHVRRSTRCKPAADLDCTKRRNGSAPQKYDDISFIGALEWPAVAYCTVRY